MITWFSNTENQYLHHLSLTRRYTALCCYNCSSQSHYVSFIWDTLWQCYMQTISSSIPCYNSVIVYLVLWKCRSVQHVMTASPRTIPYVSDTTYILLGHFHLVHGVMTVLQHVSCYDRVEAYVMLWQCHKDHHCVTVSRLGREEDRGGREKRRDV